MIHEQLVVGPFQVNCHILGTGRDGDALVIDPGGDVEEIGRRLDAEGLTLSRILLTHGHLDHVSGIPALQEERGGEVVMHRGDLSLLEGVDEHARMFGLEPPGIPHVDRFIEEGDRIDLDGLRLEVLHTPGHSPGGVSYRLGETVFVGDLLFLGSIGRTDLPGGSFPVLLDSVRTKLYPLGDATRVFPGHGPATTIGDERLGNPFLREVYRA